VKRREFITLLGGAAATWPLGVRAQQSGKLPTIGFLGGATASAWSNWSAAFVHRLRELGWSEGRTVLIEYRWAEGRHDRAAEIAAEFVRLKVDVIVTVATPASRANASRLFRQLCDFQHAARRGDWSPFGPSRSQTRGAGPSRDCSVPCISRSVSGYATATLIRPLSPFDSFISTRPTQTAGSRVSTFPCCTTGRASENSCGAGR
jgi:hypothetical protein